MLTTEDEAYYVDLMKQVSAAQASLERVNRVILKSHLETCFSRAVTEGRAQPAIAELLETKLVTVEHDDSLAPVAGLSAAIQDEGYEVTAHKALASSRRSPPAPRSRCPPPASSRTLYVCSASTETTRPPVASRRIGRARAGPHHQRRTLSVVGGATV